jgi:hypothetical protein
LGGSQVVDILGERGEMMIWKKVFGEGDLLGDKYARQDHRLNMGDQNGRLDN